MLNTEYELLQKIVAVAQHNHTFDAQAVPIDSSNVMVFYQLIQNGLIRDADCGRYAITPMAIHLLQLRQEMYEQRAQDARNQRRSKIGQILLQILTAALTAIISTLVTLFFKNLLH